MSEDLLLARLARRPGLVDSPLGAIAAPYVSALRAARYSSHTIRSYLSAIAHFGYWINTHGLDLSSIGPKVIDQYLGHLTRCACPASRKTDVCDNRAALRLLLRLMPRDDLGSVTAVEAPTPLQAELERFQHYLSNICGLAANTCCNRIRHVRAFLEAYHRTGLTEVMLPTRQDIDCFFADVAQRNVGRRHPSTSFAVAAIAISGFERWRGIRPKYWLLLCQASRIGAAPICPRRCRKSNSKRFYKHSTAPIPPVSETMRLPVAW